MSDLKNSGRYTVMPKAGDKYYFRCCNCEIKEFIWQDQLANFVDWDTRIIYKTRKSCEKSPCKKGDD